ncbi:MAG: NAD(P)H-dependent oxidoreductase subunit E [Verrucomicrobia bacterium]|nr:NAD(P)H-dependent oxidoreductase subunit E [Verrucomicrobiota bacterium]MDA1066282.1 NAD(P)H-dependent oxidoreductase subunit E [Verrucomicrobiota bacterium]
MSKNLSDLTGRKGVQENLFTKIGELAANGGGTPSLEELNRLADEFLIGKANIYGTATFYDFLKPENQGKKVYVCNGSACLCAGTQDGLISDLKGKFKEEEIGHMTCLGRCHENGAFHYDGKNYSALDKDGFESVFKGEGKNQDDYAVGSHGHAVLTAPFEGMEVYADLLKTALAKDSAEVLEEVKAAGVRGRGGAGFPMGVKWEFARNAKSDLKFIICNADEGDPGAYSDRYLLEQRPHAVLFGMIIGGYCMGAEWGVLYIRAEYPESFPIIESAIEDFRSSGLLGQDINGSGFNFDFKIVPGQGSYICGEETALISSIEGQRPEVRVRPPFPAQKGLFNKPTIVNNVETLAVVPYVIKNGGAAYAALGTEKSNGTKLVSLDSYFNRPGIYEVEMGTPLSTVVNELGGGFKEPVKALHIGGPLGGMVPASKIDELTIDFESFASGGFLLGHASVVCIPETFPIMTYLVELMDFAAVESCGKCFPCRLGTKRAHEMLESANTSSYRIDTELFDDLLHTLTQGSLCAHGGGIPLPVRNALQYFEEELEPYFTKEVSHV